MRRNAFVPLYSKFMATLSVLDSFSLTQKDNILTLEAEIAEHKKSFTGSMPDLDIMMVELGSWLTQLPKSIWIDKK